MSGSSIIGIALCAAVITLLRPYLRSPAAPTRERIVLMKTAASTRLICGILATLLLLLELLSQVERLPASARWVVSVPALLTGLVWIVNAAAGLWALSPFAFTEPGLSIVAAGRRGKIVRYGMTRLELLTSAGWSVYLPYLALVYRPVAAREKDRRARLQLAFQRPSWSDDELAFLRQAVILSPYRDMTAPAAVSRRADRVTIELGVSQDAAEAHVRHFLEQIVAGFDAAPKRASPEKLRSPRDA